MFVYVFLGGAIMTGWAMGHIGFWEGFVCGCVTLVGTMLTYRFIDRDMYNE